jgi:N-acetylglucosaminyl-diphospho-decaprenol L-rhamnosyltransferase
MNTTVIIVSFRSDDLLLNNIKNFNQDTKIIIIENSKNEKLKSKIESKFKNVSIILNNNKGFGNAANLGASIATTKYLLFCSPDNIIENNGISKLEKISENLNDQFIILNLSDKNSKPQQLYKINKTQGILCFFLIKKKFIEVGGFDEKFFLYYEDTDLVKRVLKTGQSIYQVPVEYTNLLGSHDKKYNEPIEVNRNWHLMWSKFYFESKHYGYFYALLSALPYLLRSIFKIIIFFKNLKKRELYLARASGLYNSIILKDSWYRPKINQK